MGRMILLYLGGALVLGVVVGLYLLFRDLRAIETKHRKLNS